MSSDDAGATLTCEDGTSYGGSIILGADGAHSTVRKHMETQAGVDQTPFLTTYRCLWIRFPTATCPELRPGATSETHGPGISSQLFSGRETTVAGLYIRLDRPTRARTRYSRLDEQSVVEQWADLPLLPSRALTVLEAYNKRIESGLVSLEEGVAHHWHWDGRIVLAGDALHKYTPSTGAGCNQGIMDVVSLSNHLRAAVDEAASQGVSEPSATRIQDAFEAYRSERWLMAHAHRNMSGLMTGLSTWSNWFFGLLDRWPMRFEMVQRTALFSMATLDARMPVLDYVECEERFAGSTPWARRLPAVH